MRDYRIVFKSGSSDIVSAKNAAEAREKAERSFGAKVSTVEVIEDDFADDEEEQEDEDEE